MIFGKLDKSTLGRRKYLMIESFYLVFKQRIKNLQTYGFNQTGEIGSCYHFYCCSVILNKKKFIHRFTHHLLNIYFFCVFSVETISLFWKQPFTSNFSRFHSTYAGTSSHLSFTIRLLNIDDSELGPIQGYFSVKSMACSGIKLQPWAWGPDNYGECHKVGVQWLLHAVTLKADIYINKTLYIVCSSIDHMEEMQ